MLHVDDLSTAGTKTLHKRAYLGISSAMHEDRIANALGRMEAAMARIAAARKHVKAAPDQPAAGSARVVELVNKHEKLREQVTETLRELDGLISKLEE